ncbi:16S rRNA (uracil(1498)-N(3))-methyltransferase [Nesterenkonia lutea]|uniref:Ribosomal RNA small subunit methyltransferase E n=1 Tax=Nesterenkonia lutea TaxID=272919 RepID=A0ABR9JDR6_9MICC|nr:16S rRNA (uracil(1498)-N(3))-methyltransferase [Nesterenkonia lutea]MBE1524076.1 16S rRNA (uracil1498-N3)-methyltransferase [Nesterenkonia lutea]
MTAPLFHLSPGALDAVAPGASVTLSGAEGHHAATVMRMQPGEQVLLSDTVGLRAEGLVRAAGGGELQVEILELTQEPVLRPRIVLVQALAKDRRDLQGVESATELGVDAVIPWQAERSVARWKAGRETKKHAEWVALVRTAAKQTRRTTIPAVRPLQTTAQYRDALSAAGDRIGAIALHETDQTSLAQAVTAHCGSGTAPEELHLIIGPEGGISDREIELLSDAGARVARLGPTVLRSSTAGPAALAATQLLLGRWDWSH